MPLLVLLSDVRRRMETGRLQYQFPGLDTILGPEGADVWSRLPFHLLIPRNKGKTRQSTGNSHLTKCPKLEDSALTLGGLKDHPSMDATANAPSPGYDRQTDTITIWIGE